VRLSGGATSNVIAFLAKADFPLSVALTAVSTLLAAVVTPILSALLMGTEVELDVKTLCLTTA
jgi:BASS family bile acid:Na+ symporter